MKEKINEELKKKCIEIAGSDWQDTYALIQQERKEAVRGFAEALDIGSGTTAKFIEEYLSQQEKENKDE